MRGDAYRKLGQPQSAIEDLEQAIHLYPNLGEAYASRALTYALLDKDLETRQDIDRALELGGNVHPVAKRFVDFTVLKETLEKLIEQP